MTKKVHKQLVKGLKIHSRFFARDAWRHMSVRLNKRRAQLNSRPRLRKPVFDPGLLEKPMVQPMMEFSQLMIIFRATIFKKICKTEHILLVCKKSVLQIFIVLCMNVKSDPISYS